LTFWSGKPTESNKKQDSKILKIGRRSESYLVVFFALEIIFPHKIEIRRKAVNRVLGIGSGAVKS